MGIVRLDLHMKMLHYSIELTEYHIAGGNGLLPLAKGNSWTYRNKVDKEYLDATVSYEVCYADDKSVLISDLGKLRRYKYDENSWTDMVYCIAQDYIDDNDNVCDVSHPIERAEALAKTPYEKAHTKACASVARRIMETNSTFNPDYTATGHWNFFNHELVIKENGRVKLSEYDYRFDFEYKSVNGSIAGTPLLHNDIYGILHDGTSCIWSDEWKIGTSSTAEFNLYNFGITTHIYCEDGGTITTKAGIFENCLKLRLEISGAPAGWSYRGGNKVYYFAEGVGIVRVESEYCHGTRTAVYELTEYTGTGKGYMPIEDGMMRRYDAIGLTDGYQAWSIYTYAADEDGDVYILSDRAGIRNKLCGITDYNSIEGEIKESELWDAWKHDESRIKNALNNFNLICHYIERNGRNWCKPERGAASNKMKLRIIETLTETGEVSDGLLGCYARMIFHTACNIFGCNNEATRDEGYEYLEKAFEYMKKWQAIPDGTELDIGDEQVFMGIKYVKGKGILKLPDGSIEPLSCDEFWFNADGEFFHHAMTAPRGWEWFDPVRNEERFKQYIEEAKKLMGGNE